MIRHVVLAKIRSDVLPEEVAAIFADLDALRTVLTGMTAFAHGLNVSPEGLGRGATHAFTADFADAAARDAYLAHPAHVAAGSRLVRAAEGGVEGLTVVDFVPQRTV